MSRCFPYPPPGYSRNGATYEALIESIKLQKENDKAKTDRKKEKKAKKEKKEKKEKRKDSEKSKLLKNIKDSQQESHKQLQTSANLKEQSISFNNERKDPTFEQLEKSDVTEEHGQPIDSHKPSYSSDSTQNSNKRKRDDPVIPDDSNHDFPVKPIKIRLFKKQKGPDSIKETACSVSGISGQQNHSSQDTRLNGISIPSLPSTSNSVNGQRTNLVARNRKTGIPETSTSHDRKKQIPIPSTTKKSDVAVLHSNRQQAKQKQQIPIPIPSYRRQLEHEIPIPSSIPVPAPSVSRRNDAAVVSSSGRLSIDEKKKDPISEIPSKVGPTRSEKKMMKKHLKYEKLIGSWVPPVLETQLAAVDGGDDDDWLTGSGKVRAARSASSRDDMDTCREMTWQPCARFLVEADVYALPYTVPF